MEQSALAADYGEVARRCKILEERRANADRLEVSFSTGHRCVFDLRWRKAEAPSGTPETPGAAPDDYERRLLAEVEK